jgi:hypothetical protein
MIQPTAYDRARRVLIGHAAGVITDRLDPVAMMVLLP